VARQLVEVAAAGSHLKGHPAALVAHPKTMPGLQHLVLQNRGSGFQIQQVEASPEAGFQLHPHGQQAVKAVQLLHPLPKEQGHVHVTVDF
jgi:hypothetical protein